MVRIIITTISLILLGMLFPLDVMAYSLVERDELSLDESLSVKDTEMYALPEKILVTRIHGAPEEITKDPTSWIDMLYYYFVTRLEFADLPFNYIVDRQGEVYQARAGWGGLIPELAEPEGVVMIAYLSNSSDISIPASRSMEDLVEDLSYQYGITRDKIDVVDLTIATKAEPGLSKIIYTRSETQFATEFRSSTAGYTLSSKPNISLSLELLEMEVPEDVEANSVFDVKLSIKNIGDKPWFTFNDYIYLVTSSREDSRFAVNNEWDSFDTPAKIEGETVFPDETIEITFKMRAPFLPGDYTENFGFKRIDDERLVAGSGFTVGFSVNAGDLKLVQILETGTGFLNVRSQPSTRSEVLTRISVGETFLMSEKTTGWYKIYYNEEEQGWVTAQYIREL